MRYTPPPPAPSLSRLGSTPVCKFTYSLTLKLTIMEESKNLNFLRTYTVENFKATFATGPISIKQNSKTNKYFFSFGDRGGKISTKGYKKSPMVSLCHETKEELPSTQELAFIGRSIRVKNADGTFTHAEDPRAGGYFFLLHNEGESNVVTTIDTL